MGTAKGLIATARKSIGMSGRPNRITKWYARTRGHGSAFLNAPWCDMAVTYWARHSGNAGAVLPGGDRAYTVWHAQDFKKRGQWKTGTVSNVRKAKPGDIVFFDWGRSNSIGAIDHVGIVEKNLGGGKLRTIEANISNRCGRFTRTASTIAGYGRPNYGGGGNVGDEFPTDTGIFKPKAKTVRVRVPVGPRIRKKSKVVMRLQNALLEAGYPLPKWGVDGEYGPETEAAVRRLQKDYNLKQTGNYNRKTNKALRKAVATKVPPRPEPVKPPKKGTHRRVPHTKSNLRKLGTKGGRVLNLQKCLSVLGYDVPKDSTYVGLTVQRLRHFQAHFFGKGKDHGTYGPGTMDALDETLRDARYTPTYKGKPKPPPAVPWPEDQEPPEDEPVEEPDVPEDTPEGEDPEHDDSLCESISGALLNAGWTAAVINCGRLVSGVRLAGFSPPPDLQFNPNGDEQDEPVEEEPAEDDGPEVSEPEPDGKGDIRVPHARSNFGPGDSGKRITNLQKCLLALGYALPEHGADGDFGPETESALRAYQSIAPGINETGVYGLGTMEAMTRDLEKLGYFPTFKDFGDDEPDDGSDELGGSTTKPAKGIDVSNHQPDFNWKKAIDKYDLTFAIVKATEHGSFTDREFERNWRIMKKRGLVRGAYHFARPGRTKPKTQARHFVNFVKNNGGIEKGDILVLDIEDDGGKSNRSLSLWCKRFMKHVNNFAPEAGLMVYSGRWFTSKLNGLQQYPLWVADYRNPPKPGNLGGSVSHWDSWLIHQYTSSPYDLNYSRSSAAEIKAACYQAGR